MTESIRYSNKHYTGWVQIVSTTVSFQSIFKNQNTTITNSGITACNSEQQHNNLQLHSCKTTYNLFSFLNRMKTTCYHSVIIGLFSLALGFCSLGFCSSVFLRQNNLINLQYNVENKTNTSLYSRKKN